MTHCPACDYGHACKKKQKKHECFPSGEDEAGMSDKMGCQEGTKGESWRRVF